MPFTIATKVGPSEASGFGVYSAEKIKKGQVIWIMNEEKEIFFTKSDLDKLEARTRDRLYELVYYCEYFKCFVLCSDNSCFMNHSDEPNCGDLEETTTIALRDIEIGEELTADYSTYDQPGYENVLRERERRAKEHAASEAASSTESKVGKSEESQVVKRLKKSNEEELTLESVTRQLLTGATSLADSSLLVEIAQSCFSEIGISSGDGKSKKKLAQSMQVYIQSLLCSPAFTKAVQESPLETTNEKVLPSVTESHGSFLKAVTICILKAFMFSGTKVIDQQSLFKGAEPARVKKLQESLIVLKALGAISLHNDIIVWRGINQ